MSLDTALLSAISSLKVNQEAISLISENIANANTDNYTRRQVSQTTKTANGAGTGARVTEIRRVVDDFLTDSAQRQISHVGRSGALTEFFDRFQLFFGEPNSENNINGVIDNLFSAISDLTNNPEQSFLRNNVVDKAQLAANEISSLANNLEQSRFDADQEIKDTIDRLNGYVSSIFNLNVSIKETDINGGDKNPLLDERDSILTEIAKIIDVDISYSPRGEVNIAIANADLVSIGSRSEVQYSPLISADNFIDGTPTAEISVVVLDDLGQPTQGRTTLVSASNANVQETNLASGRLKGLLEIRDQEIPNILAQLDELARTLKDTFNAIHNDGAGFPPADTLTGTNLISLNEAHNFAGKVRIGVVSQTDGSPAMSPYSTAGLPPLTLDLSQLNGGSGAGIATTQNIINEINEYFGPPPTQKVTLGPIDDIRVAAISSNVTSTESTGTLTLTGNPSIGETITINGVVYTFKDDGLPSVGNNIEIQATSALTVTEIANHLNQSVNPAVSQATYTTNSNILTVTHDTAGTAGDAFTIAEASTNITASGATLTGGANASGNFILDFEMTNTRAGSASFEVLSATVSGAPTVSTTLPAGFSSFTIPSGERLRTDPSNNSSGSLTIDLSGSTLGEGGVHTLSVAVRVTDSNGIQTTSTIDFDITIPDPNTDIRNQRFDVSGLSVAGDATLTSPTNAQRYLTASLVDANGAPTTESGYLRIVSNRTGFGFAIDELDSQENGVTSDVTDTGTGRGLSHFYGLNDFFESSSTVKNSAVNLAVRKDFIDNPSKFASGELVLSNQPSDPNADPIFTYEIGSGGIQIANKLAELNSTRVNFSSAGTLASINATIGGYSSEIISFSVSRSDFARDTLAQDETIFNAFNDRIKAFSGVNVDEELAHTINFQNNFAASARIVNVISDLFERLVETF